MVGLSTMVYRQQTVSKRMKTDTPSKRTKSAGAPTSRSVQRRITCRTDRENEANAVRWNIPELCLAWDDWATKDRHPPCSLAVVAPAQRECTEEKAARIEEAQTSWLGQTKWISNNNKRFCVDLSVPQFCDNLVIKNHALLMPLFAHISPLWKWGGQKWLCALCVCWWMRAISNLGTAASPVLSKLLHELYRRIAVSENCKKAA